MPNRRHFLHKTLAGALGAFLLPSCRSAEPASSNIRVDKLNYFEIRVRDVDRSVGFYQRVFGLPVISRNQDRVILQIGESLQTMAIRPAGRGEDPAITELGYSVPDYDLQTQLSILRGRGFTEISPPDIALPGLDNAMTTWVRKRGDTDELYFSDARGLIVRLSDASWCGGSGPLGNQCTLPENPGPGLMALGEINHFTSFVNDGAGANQFYKEFFGLEIQAYQGPGAPVNGIGDGKQFVMYAGPFPGAENAPANIHHASFNMDDFIVDDILELLGEAGLTAQNDRALGPLMYYISLRMPARGGVEGGTPEVYFTDPDGIRMQLQDSSYCGGGGYLGEICLI